MLQVVKEEGSVPIKIWTNDVEPQALEQLKNLAKLPFIHKHVAAMPDVHVGYGSTVGSVIPTIRAIIPAAVGVDIGCGMTAHQLAIKSKDLPDNLAAVRAAMEAAVPHGRTDNGGLNDRGAWGELPHDPAFSWGWLSADKRLVAVCENNKNMLHGHRNAGRHLGTLGTGNHFIELCLDLEDNVWIMLHSGSRGIGNRIGTYFIQKAKEEMEKWYIHLPDKDLAYFPEGSKYFDDYVNAVSWAQDYAAVNRSLMMSATKNALYELTRDERILRVSMAAYDCHHNYVEKENHYGQNIYVTRKGAVRARTSDYGIIPGSMGAKSFIVRGKGCPDSFNSCSHGAGRRMSRSEAKKTITLDEFKEQTKGVECRKDASVLDEAPGAYKPILEVMAQQTDLVEVVTELRQIVCVKG